MLTLGRGSGDAETRLASFSCGAGFDSAVVERAEQELHRKYRLAGLHYAWTAATVAWNDFTGHRAGLIVKSGDRSVSAVAVFVRLYDRYTYFGRVPVRFGAYVPDKLGVLVARSMNRRRIPAILGRAVTGRDIGRVDGFEAWSGVTALEVIAPDSGGSAPGGRGVARIGPPGLGLDRARPPPRSDARLRTCSLQEWSKTARRRTEDGGRTGDGERGTGKRRRVTPPLHTGRHPRSVSVKLWFGRGRFGVPRRCVRCGGFGV